jgi:hypothetical protein
MFNRCGLVKHNKALLYGHKHGFGQWLPMWFKQLVVGVWNRYTCNKFGHTGILIKSPDDAYPVCTNCCREAKDAEEYLDLS